MALGFLLVGQLTAQAQQQGGRGGRQFDPAQIQDRLQQMGIDPAQLQERLQQMGIDPAIMDRMRAGAAQQAGGGQAAQNGGGNFALGSGQNMFDPAVILDRTIDAYQQQLEFADDEWAVVRPLVKDVIEKRNALATDSNQLGMLASLGSGRGAGAFGRQTTPAAEPAPEEAALRTALDNSAGTADLKAKLEEYRVAKKKQADALKASRDKLRKVLSVRREAKAVLIGLLE